jgi:DNA-binding Lrp family transcriptional regulator
MAAGSPLRSARLDDVDRRLVELLQADGRQGYSALARAVGMTEKTVRRRVTALIGGGVVQVAAVTNPVLLGFRASGLVGVELDGTRSADEVAAALVGLPQVDYVVVATGRFPLYVEVICVDRDELRAVVDGTLRRTAGVRTAELFPYLSFHYQQAHFAVARSKRPDARGVRPVALDDLDRRLITELSLDGRVPFQHVADRLGVSEALVRQRYRQLVDDGVVQVIGIVNPLLLGYETTAWLAIRVALGTPLAEVADRLSRLPFVSYVAICAGRFDIFAEVVCTSDPELLELLDTEIRTMAGISDLEVAVYLALHYRRIVPR